MDGYRNLLFCFRAESGNVVSADELRSLLPQWSTDFSASIGSLLGEAGILDDAVLADLLNEVEQAVVTAGNDPRRAFEAAGGADAIGVLFGGSLVVTEEGDLLFTGGGTDFTLSTGAGSKASDPLAETMLTEEEGDRKSMATQISMPDQSDVRYSIEIQNIPAVHEHPGRYELVKEFKSGGMGQIIIVHDKHLKRNVALKELLPSHLEKMGTRPGTAVTELMTVPIVARFMQEAQITGQLEHPSIVPIYELGYREDGSIYYTMKLVQGDTLQDAIQQAGSFENRLKLLKHFVDLCYAVAYAHNRGVIHRDIKPLNVMVGVYGETILIDWGISKVKGRRDIHERDIEDACDALKEADTGRLTQTIYGQAMGSPYFMPPEQAEGEISRIDERSDTYALAAVLYTILTGSVPFLGMSPMEFIANVSEVYPDSVLKKVPDCPPELVAIVDKGMKKNQDERYQNAKELADEISNYLSGGLVRAHQYKFSEHLKRFVKKHKAILTTSAAALAILVLVSLYSYAKVVNQRNLAVEAKIEEEKAKVAAIASRDAELVAKEDAQRQLYYANISLADSYFSKQQLGEVRSRLVACPAPFRNWEWGYLQRQCDLQQMVTLEAGGNRVLFLSDTRMLLKGNDGGVQIADALNGAIVSSLVPEGERNPRVGMGLSRDAKRLVLSTDTEVRVLETEGGNELFAWQETDKASPSYTHQAALSTDGTLVAARNNDRIARVWRVDSGEEVLSMKVEQPARFQVYFVGDNQLVTAKATFGAAGTASYLVKWDLGTGTPVSETEIGAAEYIEDFVADAAGKRAIVRTSKQVVLWDLEQWRELRRYAVPTPQSVAISSNGQLAAAGTEDGHVWVWSCKDGAQVGKWTASTSAVRALAFDVAGERLATGSADRSVKVWNPVTAHEQWEFRGHTAVIFDLAFNPGGKKLASAAFDATTRLWDVSSSLARVEEPRLAYARKAHLLGGGEGTDAVIWDAASGEELSRMTGHTGKVERAALSDDGALLATKAVEDANDAKWEVIRLWDAQAKNALGRLVPAGKATFEMAFSADGTFFMAQSVGTLQIWSVSTQEEVYRQDGARKAAFHPNENVLAIAIKDDPEAKDGSITVTWRNLDAGTEKKAVTTEGISGLVVTMGFSIDGSRFYVSRDSTEEEGASALIVPYPSGGQAQVLRPVDGSLQRHVTAVAFSPNGTQVVVGTDYRLARIYDIASGEVLHTMQQAQTSRVGFSALRFLNDTRIVSASDDGTYRLWDAETGRETLAIQDTATRKEGLTFTAGTLDIAPDGTSIIAITEPYALAPVVLQTTATHGGVG